MKMALVTRYLNFKPRGLCQVQKCKLKPMTQDIINAVNMMGEEEGVTDGIQFLDVHGKATLMDLYPVEENDDDSCVSDDNYSAESSDDDLDNDDDNLDDENLHPDDLALLEDDQESRSEETNDPPPDANMENKDGEDDSDDDDSDFVLDPEEEHDDDETFVDALENENEFRNDHENDKPRIWLLRLR